MPTHYKITDCQIYMYVKCSREDDVIFFVIHIQKPNCLLTKAGLLSWMADRREETLQKINIRIEGNEKSLFT